MTQIQMIQNEIPYVTIVHKTKDVEGNVHTFHSHVDYMTYMFNFDTIENIFREVVKENLPTGHTFLSYEVIDLRSSNDISDLIKSNEERFVYR